MVDENDSVMKQYYCRVCKDEHYIKLNKNICEGRENYPFPFIFLHGDLKNILTTIYIDKNMEIRGVDVQKLTDEDIFSKQQAISIAKNLMNEIERLSFENLLLKEEIETLKKNKNDSKIISYY